MCTYLTCTYLSLTLIKVIDINTVKPEIFNELIEFYSGIGSS